MSERTTSTCAVIGKHQADGADCCEGPQEKAPRLGGAWRKACFTASLVTVVVVMLVMLASCRNRKGGLARLMLPPVSTRIISYVQQYVLRVQNTVNKYCLLLLSTCVPGAKYGVSPQGFVGIIFVHLLCVLLLLLLYCCLLLC